MNNIPKILGAVVLVVVGLAGCGRSAADIAARQQLGCQEGESDADCVIRTPALNAEQKQQVLQNIQYNSTPCRLQRMNYGINGVPPFPQCAGGYVMPPVPQPPVIQAPVYQAPVPAVPWPTLQPHWSGPDFQQQEILNRLRDQDQRYHQQCLYSGRVC